MLYNDETYKSEKGRSVRKWINPGSRLIRFISLLVCGFLCFSVSHTVYAENIYEPVDAVIIFKCADVEQIENNRYQITIRNEDSSAPLPKNDTVNVNDSGEGSFEIHITEPGTYDYLVYQIKGEDEKVNYDSTVYEVHVFVISNDNNELGYSVAVNVADTDRKPAIMEFENMAADVKDDTEDVTEEITEVPTEDTTEIITETEEETEEKTEEKTEEYTEERTEEKTEGKSETTVDNTSAKTGDNAGILKALILVILSAIFVTFTIVIKKVRNRTDR